MTTKSYYSRECHKGVLRMHWHFREGVLKKPISPTLPKPKTFWKQLLFVSFSRRRGCFYRNLQYYLRISSRIFLICINKSQLKLYRVQWSFLAYMINSANVSNLTAQLKTLSAWLLFPQCQPGTTQHFLASYWHHTTTSISTASWVMESIKFKTQIRLF